MPNALNPELIDQIRSSLRDGRGVRLFGDEEPVAKLEQLDPISSEGEAFLDTKLERIADLLEQGYIVNIFNDGTVSARTPDRSALYFSEPQAEIDVFDRQLVKEAFAAGSTVAFEPDGALVIQPNPGAPAPDPEVAAALYESFEHAVDSGDLQAELDAGRAYTFDVVIVTDEAPKPTDDTDGADATAAELARTQSAALDAAADAQQAAVDAARAELVADFTTNLDRLESARLEGERALAGLNAERAAAASQLQSLHAQEASARQFATDRASDAEAARQRGDEAGVAAAEADITAHNARVEVIADKITETQGALDETDAAIERASAELDDTRAELTELRERAGALEDGYNEQDAEIAATREAAQAFADIERLERAFLELSADKADGLHLVREDIDALRTKAAAALDRAGVTVDENGVVTSERVGTVTAPTDAPAADDESPIDPDDIEIDDDDAADPSSDDDTMDVPDVEVPDVEVPEEMSDDDMSTGEMSGVEVPEIDMSTPEPIDFDMPEIEIPDDTSDFASDFGTDSFDASPSSSVIDDSIIDL